ncbi:MAG TPA: hypothetical protein DCG38_11250 [Eubacteriaceae bacterium]|nr:hypothetical protein [Eubacteriaceae bacterium]
MMFNKFVKPSKPAYAKILIHGAAGVGKTFFSLSHPGKGYLIDTEGGANHYADLFPNIEVLHTVEFDEIIKALDWLKNNAEPNSFLVFDSETIFWDALQYQKAQFMHGSEIRVKQLNLSDWGVIKRIVKNIHQMMNELDMDVIAIAHEKTNTTDAGGVLEYIPVGEQNIPYYFDMVMRMVKNGSTRRIEVLKNRLPNIITGEVIDVTCRTWGEAFEEVFPLMKRTEDDIVRDWNLKVVMVENKEQITALVRELDNVEMPEKAKEEIKEKFRWKYKKLSIIAKEA